MKRILILCWLCGWCIGCKRAEITLPYTMWQLPTNLNLSGFYAQNADTLYITAGDQYTAGGLFRSPDGGATWEQAFEYDFEITGISTNGTNMFMSASTNVYFTNVSADTAWWGYVIGEWTFWHDAAFWEDGSGIVVGGANFSIGKIDLVGTNHLLLQHDSTKNEWYDVCLAGDSVVHLAGYGAVYKSLNRGKTWQPSEARGDAFVAIQFVTPSVGYVLGRYGSLLKTTDGGETWNKLRGADTWSKRRYNSIYWLDEQQAYAAGNDGLLERTQDGGKTWEVIEHEEEGDWKRVAGRGGAIYVLGEGGRCMVLE